MRRSAGLWIAVAALSTLGACKREPSFDERYASAQKAIRDKASELDKDMATRAAEANEATPEPSGQPREAAQGET